jgi:hypothetical protein
VSIILCFDIDETICKTTGTDYSNSTPIKERIDQINELFDQGNIIKLLTARGAVSGIDWTEVTEKQLSLWGLKYHELHLTKPYADIYVDDKGANDIIFFNNLKNSSIILVMKKLLGRE